MPKKSLQDMVWSVEHYNEKIKFAVKARMSTYYWLTFTEKQLAEVIATGYSWLQNNNEKQLATLRQIIRLTCRSLTYQGAVVEVEHKLNTAKTWQWKTGATNTDSSAIIITGNEATVSSDKAKQYLNKNGPVRIGKLSELQRL